METGFSPAENGEPVTSVRVPLAALQVALTCVQIAYADTLFDPELVTYKKLLRSDVTTVAAAEGVVPAIYDVTRVSVPSLLTEN